MKNISILSLHLGYGGIEKSVVALANTMCSKYNVEIAVCYKLYDEPAFELDKRVKVKYLNDDLKPNQLAFKEAFKNRKYIKFVKEGLYGVRCLYLRRKTMVDYIKNCCSDVIISTRDIFNYWLSDYGKEGVLKVGWEHNHFHDDYRYATGVVNSAKKLDYLILVSSELQKYYSYQLRNSKCKCVYIPNSIDKMPTELAPLKSKNLISVGRLSPEKGHLDLLKLFNLLIKKYPDWKLNIIGDGTEREKIESYIKKYNLDGKVILHGFQGKKYVDKMLHDSSIYLMTSYTESFGIVLIEAMSHGIPCVAFDSAEGAREIINSGENGYLIKNRNFNAMLMKVGSLIEKESERIRLGKLARESVKKYSSDIVKDKWITLIEESGIDG